eukprot:1155895-Pelagomonas_calceolata.AAC.3
MSTSCLCNQKHTCTKQGALSLREHTSTGPDNGQSSTDTAKLAEGHTKGACSTDAAKESKSQTKRIQQAGHAEGGCSTDTAKQVQAVHSTDKENSTRGTRRRRMQH